MSRQSNMVLAEQVRALLSALDGLIFDIAMVVEHARDDVQGREQPLFCARIMVQPNGKIIPRHRRWLPFLPEVETWALGNSPWIGDLRKVARARLPGSKNNIGELPGVQTMLRRKIRSILCMAICEGDRLSASVMICSKQKSAYDQNSLEQLKSTTAAKLARKLFNSWNEGRANLIREMRAKFSPRLSPEKLAKELVTKLANELDWEFVGIYRVENRFVLIGSCDRTRKRLFNIEPQHRQDLDKGMMGTTLRRCVCLRADDVTVAPRPYNYMPLDGFPARSALCYPIVVGGKVEWILDCASVHASAFRGPDLEVLKILVESLRSTLELWFEYRLSTAILNGINQHVLVVDRDGIIQRANRSANAAFGPSLKGRSPATLAYDEASRHFLSSLQSVQSTRVQMCSSSGRAQAMFATARMSSEAFGRWILQFTDADEQQILTGLSYAKATVVEIATSARSPLMLARALVGKISRAVMDGAMPEATRDELSRVTENLSKVDLNYERLARALSGSERVGLSKIMDQLRHILSSDGIENIKVDAVVRDAQILGSQSEVSDTIRSVLHEITRASAGHVTHIIGSAHIKYISIHIFWRDISKNVLSDFVGSTESSRLPESIVPMADIPMSNLEKVQSVVREVGWGIERSVDGIELKLPHARAELPDLGIADD